MTPLSQSSGQQIDLSSPRKNQHSTNQTIKDSSNSQEEIWKSLLQACAGNYRQSSLKDLFDTYGDEIKKVVNKKNKDGETPLMIATSHGNLEAVQYFLGFDDYIKPNLRDKNGETALMRAARSKSRNSLNIVKSLLGHDKIKLGIKNNDRQTALEIAVKNNNQQVISIIRSISEGLKFIRKNLQQGASSEIQLKNLLKHKDKGYIKWFFDYYYKILSENPNYYKLLHTYYTKEAPWELKTLNKKLYHLLISLIGNSPKGVVENQQDQQIKDLKQVYKKKIQKEASRLKEKLIISYEEHEYQILPNGKIISLNQPVRKQLSESVLKNLYKKLVKRNLAAL